VSLFARAELGRRGRVSVFFIFLKNGMWGSTYREGNGFGKVEKKRGIYKRCDGVRKADEEIKQKNFQTAIDAKER